MQNWTFHWRKIALTILLWIFKISCRFGQYRLRLERRSWWLIFHMPPRPDPLSSLSLPFPAGRQAFSSTGCELSAGVSASLFCWTVLLYWIYIFFCPWIYGNQSLFQCLTKFCCSVHCEFKPICLSNSCFNPLLISCSCWKTVLSLLGQSFFFIISNPLVFLS